MKHIPTLTILVSALIWIAACVATQQNTDITPVETDGVPRISIQQLKSMLDSRELVLIDTRQTQQWKVSDQKIPGAEHQSSFEAREWSEDYRTNATVVLYCA